MSCTICLLPFVPHAKSVAPRPPPSGILTPQQDAYLRTAYGLGTRVMGVIAKYDYLDNNMFGNVGMMFLQWEGDNGTFFMMHVACANILRRIFNAESMGNEDGLVRLLEIEEVLGRPLTGVDAGRLNFVPYEEIGTLADRVDIQRFWQAGYDLGLNVFLWNEFSHSDAAWTLAKPDIFPRFFSQVKPERVAMSGPPAPQPGTLMQQPLDILIMLLPYLSHSVYLALTSTCRLIRLHALTTFQPHARARVLELGWATPLLALGEYDAFVKRKGSVPHAIAHPELSPTSGDWLLYLSHVHRTTSMRARRRIWNICLAVQCTVTERLPSSDYGRNLEVNREKLGVNAAILSNMITDLTACMDDPTIIETAARKMMTKEEWESKLMDVFSTNGGDSGI